MSEAKFTPGPWSVFGGYSWPGIDSASGLSIVIFGDTAEMTGVRGDNPEEANANARLIASAPELLSALKSLLDDSERRTSGFPRGIEEWFAVRDAARAAISKAIGGQPQ